jgi:hypothetical protein
MDKRIVEKLVKGSKSRRLDPDTIRDLRESFDLNKMKAMQLIKHSIEGDYCVDCAAPLSDVGRFTRHCTVCKGINFDWRAA